MEKAALGFGALAHETRLIVFQKVIKAGPDGVTAGELASHASVSPSNLSAHLSVLMQAGLIKVRREGRMRIYSPNVEEISGLVSFLVDACCDGHPEMCAALPQTSGRTATAC